MNNSRVKAALLLLLSTVLVSCRADVSDAPLARTSLGLVAGADHLPMPAVGDKVVWDGGVVDLMVADAWAGCSYGGTVGAEVPITWNDTGDDLYLQTVHGWMSSASCPATVPSSGFWGDWVNHRALADCNRSSTGLPAAVTITKYPIEEQIAIAPDPRYDAALPFANDGLRRAAMNLCIARRLRVTAPGTAGAGALLLSSAEQRHLTEVIRERAQIAALYYAHISIVFSQAFDVNCQSTNDDPEYTYTPLLSYFAQQGATSSTLARMGDDFADAVQLLTEVTRESLELMARSSAAKLRRGGHAQTGAEERWGPGSWTQRALALLYGGDPLTIEEDSSSPWEHFKNSPRYFPGLGGALGRLRTSTGTLGWPRKQDLAFATAKSKAPEASLLLALARQYDGENARENIADPRRYSLALNFHLNGALPGDNSNIDESDVYEADSAALSASADRLYRAVEASLRTADCAGLTGTGDCATYTVDDVSLSGGYGDFLLWKKHRISPAHAEELAERLSDLFPGVTYYSSVGPFARRGTFFTKGSLIELQGPTSGGVWIRLAPDASFIPRGLESVEGEFTKYAPYRLSDGQHPDAFTLDQGFGMPSAAGQGEAKRLLGAASALEIVREALLFAQKRLQGATASIQAHVEPFFGRRARILDTIAGAIGNSATSIRPKTEYLRRTRGTTLPDDRFVYHKQESTGMDAGHSFQVRVTVPKDDPWWPNTTSGDFKIWAIAEPWEPNLARNPTGKYFGRAMDDFLTGPFNSWHLSWSGPMVSVEETSLGIAQELHVFTFDIAIPAYAAPTNNGPRNWSFLVRKATANDPEFFILASRVQLQQYLDSTPNLVEILRHVPHEGQYFSYRGELNLTAAGLMATSAESPTEPLVDGLGFPMRWIPPSNPPLVGAPSDAVATYLAKAKEAAATATNAVKDAFEKELQIQLDGLETAAARRRSIEVARLARQALCGKSGAEDCDPAFVPTAPLPGDPLPPWIRDRQSECAQLGPHGYSTQIRCMTLNFLRGTNMPVALAAPVVQARDLANAPEFEEYEGGALQPAMINQWSALRAVVTAIAELRAAEDAALATVATAMTALESTNAIVKENCGPALLEKIAALSRTEWRHCSEPLYDSSRCIYYMNGLSMQTPEHQYEHVSNGTFHQDTNVAHVAQTLKCFDMTQAIDVAIQTKVHAFHDAALQLAEAGTRLIVANLSLQSASAHGYALKARTRIAIAREQLESELIAQRQLTSTAIYARYHDYDLWRAKSLLDNARRQAVVARHAIEARFVVDLSTLVDSEPFVTAPASWADDIYDYDLSLPSSVGLSVGTDTGGAYPNRIVDYVSNLEGFVRGYAVKRPTVVLQQDSALMTLPGPRSIGDDGIRQGIHTWAFFCHGPDGGSWVGPPASGRAMEACSGQPPARARTFFTLDPWGRLNNTIAREPYLDPRFNVRWTQLAVNIVGTGVKDCSRIDGPSRAACYSQPFVAYSLSHDGPSWITNDAREWRSLFLEPGRIEAAKAIADGRLLDPLNNGFGAPFVDSVSRNELRERPVAGRYELVLDVTPAVDLNQVERIEVLTGSTFWVRQR